MSDEARGSGELADHWDAKYQGLGADRPSWYQSVPQASLDLIESVATPASGIVDVGGGDSCLVDQLLARGFHDLTVVDISQVALIAAHDRIGESPVHWVASDIRDWQPTRTFDVWHDRAAYHFLVEPADQQAYWQLVRDSVPHGGHVIVAHFADDGPDSCSGLPVQRYDEGQIRAAMGDGFEIVEQRREQHSTPWESTQSFLWTLARRA